MLILSGLMVVFLTGLTSCATSSSEESTLLKNMVKQYNAPMVIAFLHERIQVNNETIGKVKSNSTDMDKSKRDTFDLAQKSLTILDQHLTALEKADFFSYNGTEKMNNFIEQFTMSIEMFPVQLDEKTTLEMPNTVDQLIQRMNSSKIASNDLAINQTNEMIQMYLDDIEEKETNVNSNRIQKLSATLTKAQLQLLANNKYPEVSKNYHCSEYGYSYRSEDYHNCEKIDNRGPEIVKVLKQVKSIVDLFYAKFNLLGDPIKLKRSTIIIKKQKPRLEPVEQPTPSTTTTTTTSTTTTVDPIIDEEIENLHNLDD